MPDLAPHQAHAPHHHPSLRLGRACRAGLDALRGRARWALLARGASSLVLAAVALSLVSFGLDRVLRLSWSTRAALLAGGAAALLVIAWRRLVVPLRAPLPDVELARAVEAHHPALEWRLLSAVQFADPAWRAGPETSRELAALVVQDAEGLARQVDFAAPVPVGPSARAALRGVLVLLAGLLLARTFPDAFRLWVKRDLLLSRTARWPLDTLLKRLRLSTPGRPPLELWRGEDGTFRGSPARDAEPLHEQPSLVVPHGAALLVETTATGVIPPRVWADTRATEPGGRDEVVPLDALGQGRFRTALEDLAGGFELVLRGGDDETEAVRVPVIRRPWVEALQFHVTPPPHTGLPPRTFGVEAGSATLPLGTRVRVEARLSKALVAGRLLEHPTTDDPAAVHTATIGGAPGSSTGTSAGDRRSISVELDLARTAAFELQATDGDGLEVAPPMRFSLVARPDGPPEVQLRLIGVGLNVTPEATLRGVITAQDDYLVSAGRRRLKVSGAERPEVEAAADVAALTSQREAEAPITIELGPLGLVPKQSVSVWAEAQDGDPRGPNKGSSPAVQLRVVTADQLLAELLRRLHEQRLELERMVVEEEKLAQGLSGLDATTLERSARAHRDVARALLRAGETVDAIVEEMVTNKVLEQAAWDRLRTEVAQALRDLERQGLRRARELSERAQDAAAADKPVASKAAGGAAAVVVSELRAIITRMGRIEELAELVAALKRIIQQQRDILDRTRRGPTAPPPGPPQPPPGRPGGGGRPPR